LLNAALFPTDDIEDWIPGSDERFDFCVHFHDVDATVFLIFLPKILPKFEKMFYSIGMKWNSNFLPLVALGALSSASHAVRVYLPDASINAVRVFESDDGAYKGLIGSGFFNSQTYACAVNPTDGYLYVAVYSNGSGGTNDGSVLRFDPWTGAYAGQVGNGFLSDPVSIAFGPDGNMYVGDSGGGNDLIFRFNPATGAYLGTLGNGFVSDAFGLLAIGFGADGNLYASANSGQALARLNPTTGAYLGLLGNGFFNTLSAITTDLNGRLLVGQFNGTGSQMRFRETDGAYLGMFANSGFAPSVSGSGTLPNGYTVVRATSGSTQYVARFDPTDGAYKGLFAANYGMSGFGLGVEQPATITGTVDLDAEFSGGSFPAVVELRNPDGSLAEPGVTVNVTDNGSFSYTTYKRGNYKLSIKPSHWLRKGSATFAIGRVGASLPSFFCINGDLDGDNEVGPGDFEIVVADFGNSAPTPGDLDGDGETGPSDFEYVVQYFGTPGDF
jgi:DNA-binding beta-propeller fold protein YncE